MVNKKLGAAMVLIVLAYLFGWAALAADKYEPNSTFNAATGISTRTPPQLHDLEAVGGVVDEDWFWLIGQRRYRSYEALLEWDSGSALPPNFVRANSNGTVILQNATSYRGDIASSTVHWLLRWQKGASITDALLRVRGQLSMTNQYQYLMQLRETTLYCPRFNNSGTQVSVLIVQSAQDGDDGCAYATHFFAEASGDWLASSAGSLATTTSMAVLNTAGIGGLAGQKGSARATHTCGYGNLKAKLVALEPATGFPFDTPCTMREQ